MRTFTVVYAIACLTLAGAVRFASAAPIPTTNLELWLAADRDVWEASNDPAENGDAVVEWRDQSGNGHHAVPSSFSGATTPLYVTNQVNGHSALDFNAASARLTTDSQVLTGTGDFSFFAVFRTSSLTTTEQYLGGNYGTGGGSTGIEFYVHQLKPKLHLGSTLISPNTLAPNTWYMVQMERVSGVVTIRINNVDQITGVRAANIASTENWTIGAGPNYASSTDGLIAEQLVYSQALDIAERNQVLAYLEAKYRVGILPEPGTAALFAACVLVAAGRRRSCRAK